MPTPPTRISLTRLLKRPAPAIVWAVAVVAWATTGATPSPSRWLGTALLVAVPLVAWWSGPTPLRAGLGAAGSVLLVLGVALGDTSGASVGVAVGGVSAWAGVAMVTSGSGAVRRRQLPDVGAAVAATGLVLMLAPSAGTTGPRVAGAAVAVVLGMLVGRALDPGAAAPAWSLQTRTSIAVAGSITLVAVAITRTFIDVDSPVVTTVLAARRFASLVLPTGAGMGPGGLASGSVGGPVSGVAGGLAWLLPLVGCGVALLVARRQHHGTPGDGLPRPARTSVVAPLPGAVAATMVAGLVSTALLHLVAVNWADTLRTSDVEWVLWPDRTIETVLWGTLALVTGRGWRWRSHLAATAVAGVSGLVLLTVLVGEWRVDGVSLRPGLLAVPAVLAGLVALARSGPRSLATGTAVAGLPVLLVGLGVGMAGAGPSLNGTRSFIPGESPLMVGGGRLAGLLPDAGQLGLVAAAIAIAAVFVVLSDTPSGRHDTGVRTGAWAALLAGGASLILAEAKTALLAAGLAIVVAAVAHRTAIGRLGWRPLAIIGAGAGALVVAAPFVGAVVLDPTALRPEVWRRSTAALTGREWLVGLGAQPLRMDREFHTRVDSSWGAVQAHNQALELLLIAGLPGLVLMLLTVAVLVAVGLRTARVAYGWSAGAATFLLVAGASGPNLTYFGHDLSFVLIAGMMAAVALQIEPPPGSPDPASARLAPVVRLVRLGDGPRGLPAALAGVWRDGDAAIIVPPGTDLSAAVAAAVAAPAGLPAGTALVVPTSGSTGTPRAVLLSHAALSASTAASLAALGCLPGERWALALPVQHVAGLQVLARARALGTAAHVVSDPGDPQAIAAAAAHAEHIALVPTQLVRCLDAGVDLTGFRSVLVGGGPLPTERAAAARAAGVRVVQSYGMTETCGGCVYDGVPLAGVEVAIERASDGSGSDGTEVGRIRLRGPMVATGYLDPSPADAARFTADGWFVTDDVGRLRSGEGGTTLLEVVGRSDDVINTGGVKVVPAAVEDVLRGLTAVRDVVVVGVEDPEWGERVRAVVVASDATAPPTLEVLRDAVGARLPSSHAPRELVIVDTIARDGLGKLTAAERERLRLTAAAPPPG